MIKIKVTYATKERKYCNKARTVYSNIYKDIEEVPLIILRRPCGTGKAATRYFYQATFNAPSDAEFSQNGAITENICRKSNKKFSPTQFNFINDKCVIV